MIKAGYLAFLPGEIRALIALFLLGLSIGFYTGLGFVKHTTEASPQGIVENYKGNENNEMADTMKFKKSEHEMLSILHTHLLSLSLVFFILGLLSYGVPMNRSLRKFLMLEPLLSVVLTFGGIYYLWEGLHWMVYLVMFSGFLMTLSYSLAVVAIFRTLLKPVQETS
jgi:hypothetical protein